MELVAPVVGAQLSAVVKRNESLLLGRDTAVGVLYPALIVVLSIADRDKEILIDGRRGILFSIPLWPAAPLAFWFASVEMTRIYGRMGTFLIWVPIIAVSILLIMAAFRAEKRAQNPFNGFLQPIVAEPI